MGALGVEVDVTANESIHRMVEKIKERFSRIDVLANNAGASFGVPNTVQYYKEPTWLKTIDVNLHGVFRVSRAILPLMTGGRGSIINTASRAGKVPPLFNGAYAVAKAGCNNADQGNGPGTGRGRNPGQCRLSGADRDRFGKMAF